MDYLADIALAYSAYLVATVSPGPAILAIMVTSAGAGRRAIEGAVAALFTIAGIRLLTSRA